MFQIFFSSNFFLTLMHNLVLTLALKHLDIIKISAKYSPHHKKHQIALYCYKVYKLFKNYEALSNFTRADLTHWWMLANM